MPKTARRWLSPALAGWMLFFADDQQRYVGNGVENQPDDFVQTKKLIIGHV